MHWFKKYKIIIIIILSLSFLLFNFQATNAASVLWSNIPPTCQEKGFCTTCHLVQIVVNAGVFILGIIGAVALLFFVYGGFTILASGGSSEKVKKGKDIIVNSVIGLTIALLAWLVINLIITTVAGGWTWQSKLKCPGSTTPTQSAPGPGPSGSPSSGTPPDECTNALSSHCPSSGAGGSGITYSKTECFETPPSVNYFKIVIDPITAKCQAYVGSTAAPVGCYCVPSSP